MAHKIVNYIVKKNIIPQFQVGYMPLPYPKQNKAFIEKIYKAYSAIVDSQISQAIKSEKKYNTPSLSLLMFYENT